jgi:hypothetical protein
MPTNLGRVQIVKGTPPCSPGVCVVCGNPGDSNSRFIDFGFDLDFYGSIYFCENCIHEVVGLLGLVPVDRLNSALDTVELVTVDRNIYKSKYEELSGAVQLILDLDLIPSTSLEQPNVVDALSKTEQSSRKPATAKPRPPKSVNESGSTGVRNNDTSKKSADKFGI